MYNKYNKVSTTQMKKNSSNAHSAMFSVTSQRRAHQTNTENNITLLDVDDDESGDKDANNKTNTNTTTASRKVKEYTPTESYVLFLQLLTRVFRAHAILHARRDKHSLRQTPTRNEVFLTSKPVRRLHSFLSSCD